MKLSMFMTAAVIATMSPVAASAADIDTTAAATNTIGIFGSPNTATYGQTFTVDAGDTFLNSFSLFLNGVSSPLNFRGYLATWDGLKAGTLLYTSADRLLNSTAAKQEYFFAPSIAVTPGAQYVAFLSTSALSNQNVTTTMPYALTNPLPNGAFVYQNNGTDFAHLFSSAWTTYNSNADVAFKADFSARAPAVPEPASWAMMILGMGMVGFSLRRVVGRSNVRFDAKVRRIAAGLEA